MSGLITTGAPEAKIRKAAQNLFDNRLGWSHERPPYAPREFWYELGCALYGEDDSRVKELAKDNHALPEMP